MKNTCLCAEHSCWPCRAFRRQRIFPWSSRLSMPSRPSPFPPAPPFTPFQPGKPAGIVKEPPAISQDPLYGQISTGTGRLLFRLDESKGNGQGYDRLIVDVNGNGDLTGDPVVSMVPPAGGSTVSPVSQQMIFGPVQAPDNLKIGTNRPAFFARVYLFTFRGHRLAGSPNITSGEILLRPGWYLEATVNVDGKQHKVDLVDADCNFHLGDPERPTFYQSAQWRRRNWFFQGGDRFMVDWEVLEAIKAPSLTTNPVPSAPCFILTPSPIKSLWPPTAKPLSLDPWPEPLAELACNRAGSKSSSLQVAWEKPRATGCCSSPASITARPKCRRATIASIPCS